jgi:hypothetical protein
VPDNSAANFGNIVAAQYEVLYEPVWFGIPLGNA